MRWQYIPFALCALVLSACDESSEAETDWSQMAKPFCALPVQVEMRCEAPWLPDLDQFHQGAHWPLNVPEGYRAEIAYGDSTTAIDEIAFEDADRIRFEAAGVTRVFARFSGATDCPATIVSREYRVSPAYPGGPDDPASDAIAFDDPNIRGWAAEVTSLEPGDAVDEQYLASERGLGPATGEVTDVVSLGEGGTITLSFERPLADGPGPDFAVFENGFSDGFLELAFVEVSSDGEHFVRFPSAYLGLEPIGPFTEHDPELIDGLAGKYRRGYGTPFDLSVLAWSAPTQAGLVDLHRITQVRLVDVLGDGTMADTFGNPIYDPYPVRHSAGFDLDGVAVFNTVDTSPCPR